MISNESLCILQWNLHGFRTHRPFLQNAIDEIKPNIIALQETLLKESDQSYLSGFNPPFRKDRDDRSGGGVAIFKANLAAIPLSIDTESECVAVDFFPCGLRLRIINLYLPPSCSASDILI